MYSCMIHSIVILSLVLGNGSAQFSSFINSLPSFATVKNVTASFLPSLPTAPCVGHHTFQGGRCIPAEECQETGGRADAGCWKSSQVCCVSTTKCGSVIITKDVEVSNRGYPHSDNDTHVCEYTIKRGDVLVSQLRLDFMILEIGDPSTPDPCDGDHFVIQSAQNQKIFPLCGKNSGTHVVLPFASESLIIKIILGETSVPRRWLLRVRQLDTRSPLFAPLGCHQYFTDPKGVMSSFITSERVKYSSCFKKGKSRCGIRFEQQTSSTPGNHSEDEEPLLNQTQTIKTARQVSHFNPTVIPDKELTGLGPQVVTSSCSTSIFFPPTEASFGGLFWCVDEGTLDGVTVIGDLWAIYVEQSASSTPFSLRYAFVNC